MLLTTPMIRSLRLAWPEARIDALVFEGTEGVLASNPDLDRIITVQQRPTFRQHLRLLLEIWRNYDLALSMQPSDRPTFYAFMAGKHRVGLILQGGKHLWKKWLLSQSVNFDNLDTHTVLMNLKLADLLGIPRSHEVVAAWNMQDEAAVRKVLPFDPESQAYAVLHLYPMYAYKAWKRGAWVELADWLNNQGMRVVLTGGNSADEVAYVRGLMSLLAARYGRCCRKDEPWWSGVFVEQGARLRRSGYRGYTSCCRVGNAYCRIVRAVKPGEMGAVAQGLLRRPQPLQDARHAARQQRGVASRRGGLRAVHGRRMRASYHKPE